VPERFERHRGAAHVRHFIVHLRSAADGSARPLNCGVMHSLERAARLGTSNADYDQTS
jgi:hypothetical protein